MTGWSSLSLADVVSLEVDSFTGSLEIFGSLVLFLKLSQINMGPKVKRPPKNAFSFFLDEYIQDMQRTGRYISHKIAAEECGLIWQKLPESGREKYVKLAKTFKLYSKNDKTKKYTNFGVSYADLEQQQEESRKRLEQADSEIKITISNLDSELLKMHLFYIIHCNYYCKTSQGLYVPGELAIAEFNLEDGIRRSFHTLINPGDIPLGYALEAKRTIEEIHGLPYPPYPEGEADYSEICENIKKFLEPGKLADGRYSPLYCIENNIKASENILQELSEDRIEGQSLFRVYLLHKMFFWLKNKCVESLSDENFGFPVMSTAESEISKDSFCYVPGLACPFHAMSEDKYQNCSLSVVQRFVYVICDHCCQHIGVELVPGKHCRLKSDVDRKETLARLEREAQRRRRSHNPSEVEADGQSSYADDYSCFDWNRDCGGSFLHDEIESKFSAIETSSFTTRSTRVLSTAGLSVAASKPRAQAEQQFSDDDDDDEDYKKIASLGRGTIRY